MSEEKHEVDKFVKCGYCRYLPHDIRSTRTRTVLSIFEDLPPEACFAILSLRYNGEYDRDTIMKAIRERYGFPVRELIGEYEYLYGVFPEHFVVIFNRRGQELVPHDTFPKPICEIGREIVKGKATLARIDNNTFEHILPCGSSTMAEVKNVTRKNAIQWQFGDNFKLTHKYIWFKTWTHHPRAVGLNLLGRLWAEDDYPTSYF